MHNRLHSSPTQAPSRHPLARRHAPTRALAARLAAPLLLLLAAAMPHPARAQQAKTATERTMERQGMVDIKTVVPDIHVSLMYGRADNFTGQVLYTDLHTAYLHPQAARALAKAQAELKRIRPDLSLAVYDAARPMSVQQRMYNVVADTPKNIYVSNPKNGGGLHNYGLAVDITLCHAATGDTLHMGTKIDHMGRLAHVREEQTLAAQKKLSKEALKNRQLLRQVMAAGGFKVLPTEWWHFNLKSRKEARANYKVIK